MRTQVNKEKPLSLEQTNCVLITVSTLDWVWILLSGIETIVL